MSDYPDYNSPSELDSMLDNSPAPAATQMYSPSWESDPEADYNYGYKEQAADEVLNDPGQTPEEEFRGAPSDGDEDFSDTAEETAYFTDERAESQEREAGEEDNSAKITEDGKPGDTLNPPDTTSIEGTSDGNTVVLEDMDGQNQDDGVYGNSFEWTDSWFWQGETMYCGPTSAAFIVNEWTGAEITDPNILAEQAIGLGLEDDFADGMYFDRLPALLEANGVPATLQTSNMEDLAAKLEAGYGVIAGVDSGEIWGTPEDAAAEDGRMDHFLVVTEIDLNNGSVTLSDPGNPEGNALEVSIDQFDDAWEDSGYTVVTTDQVNPNLVDNQSGAGGANRNIAFANLTANEKF